MISSSLEDLYRYAGERCWHVFVQLRYYFFTPSFRYSYFLRHAQCAKSIVSRYYWCMRLKQCSYKYGIQIPYQTRIGKGLRIVHWGAIVVNPDSIIGEDCTLAQGVLIGNAQGKRKGTPIIGDRCYISANAMIIGGVKVGNDVLIAPGAFVNFDVPDNSIVIGNPGKIITRESSPTSKYIVYSVRNFK